MQLGGGRVGHHPRRSDLHLVLESVDHRGFAAIHRVPTGLRDIGGIVLLGLSDLGIVEFGAVEEVGLGRSRLEAGDGDAAVLDLLIESGSETVDERFGAVVDRLERACEVTGDRAGRGNCR